MIRVENLTKKFPNGKGIFHVSFDVNQGEVLGYLGPNGAGKSTTIRHLMGFMRAQEGHCSIDGRDCWNEAATVQMKVGYLPGEIAFVEGMTGLDFLRLLSGMRKVDTKQRRNVLIERLQFDADTPIRKMSKGMKQKVGIVAAFQHDPEVLILDEPTSGLDPLMQRTFVDLVLEEKARGKTILMSSHMFSEVERTCDRVVMVRDGHIVLQEDVHQLQSLRRRIFDVALRESSEVTMLQQAGLNIVGQHGSHIQIEVQGEYDKLIQTLSRVGVTSLDVQVLDLEELFMHLYHRDGGKSM